MTPTMTPELYLTAVVGIALVITIAIMWWFEKTYNMGFLPKQKYTTKKEHQSQEDKEKALAKAEAKRARKLKGKK